MDATAIGWLDRAAPESIIAWRGATALSRQQLCGDVGALQFELGRVEGERWLLFAEDAYACAVGLMALTSAGAVAVLPPNGEPGTLAELARGCSGSLADAAAAASPLRCLPILARARASRPASLELDLDLELIELCTSGTTGERRIVAKTARQLLAEVELLEQAFGGELADARVLGTVSHQHIYGLLFRVLWPLRSRRAFVVDSALDPAQMLGQMAHGPVVLVSSPAHLERLPKLLDLARLRARCRAVFSSGGPLERGTALQFGDALGRAPIEVLGSTETGGIAWRRRDSSETSDEWTAFAGTRVEAPEGSLHVTSAGTRGRTVATGDLIELATPTRFKLRGRGDRVVKLFEERVSLGEIETRLGAHPAVARAAAVEIFRGGAPRIGVVLELSGEGQRKLDELGRKALIAALREHLSRFFRSTVLPRSWRTVERLPEDAQGKLASSRLRQLFEEPRNASRARLRGEPLRRGDELLVELEVPHDLWCLRGHFDDLPVVPGVVQVLWVLEWASAEAGCELVPREIQVLKFKQLLRPGESFRLRVVHDRARGELSFNLENERAQFSSGRILLA